MDRSSPRRIDAAVRRYLFFEMLDYLIANNIYLLLDIYKTTWDKF